MATYAVANILNFQMKYSFVSYFAPKHYENTPMQNTAIFHGLKNDNFQMKKCDIFAQNIDCGYTQSLF